MKTEVCIPLAVISAGALFVGLPLIAAYQMRPAEFAHSEQGDFTLTAPTASAAQSFAAECLLAGASVEWIDERSFRLKFQEIVWGWWNGVRPRLTDWIISGGAPSLSLGVEG